MLNVQQKNSLIIIITSFLVMLAFCTSCDQSLPFAQYEALYDLYNATHGLFWNWKKDTLSYGSIWEFPATFPVNVSTADLAAPCTQSWQGVLCALISTDHCAVIVLELPSYNLVGSISASLGQLSQLDYLDLASNKITYTIPSSIGQLVQLQYMDLSNNFISGDMPASIGLLSNLTALYLQINFLTGPIPSVITELFQLEILDFAANSLSGTIPSNIGRLAQLQQLDFSFTFLTGAMPTSLGKLSNLTNLFLQGSFLTESIPASLGYLSQLVDFTIDTNFLTGTIPSSLGQLSLLVYLFLDTNSLTGSIPASLAGLLLLQELYLEDNFLTGTVPSFLGQLTRLQYMYLNDNSLTGMIPTSLGQLLLLQYLGLQSNFMSREIPTFFGQLQQLTYLNMCNNSLTGTISPSVGTMNLLQNLYLNSNFLSGSIPSHLSNLDSINVFDVASNVLTGTLPASFSNLMNCVQLYVNGNELTGQLQDLFYPTNMLHALELLDISDNGFTGFFPGIVFSLPRLHTLVTSSNCFTGSLSGSDIPTKSDLQLISMDGLSSGRSCRKLSVVPLALLLFSHPNPGYVPNKLMHGAVPATLWSLPKLSSISLSGNGFTGPLDMGNFDISTTNITIVSLAYNRITGSIPTVMQTYGRFQYLDLSYNRFSGTLDPGFTFEVSASSTVNISVNLLSGSLPTKSTNLLEASPNLVSTVLIGNLFEFQISDVEPSVQSTATLYNGSFELNVAMAVSSITVALWFGVIMCVVLMQRKNTPAESVEEFNDAIAKWWRAYDLCNLVQTTQCWASFSVTLLNYAIIVTVTIFLGFTLLLVKLVPSFRGLYSVYEVQYGWAWSVVYLTGVAPAALILCFVTLISIFYYTSYYPLEQEKKSLHNLSNRRGNLDQFWQEYQKNGIYVTMIVMVFVVNGIVLVVANSLYISALGSPFLTLIQASLAIFKFTWSKSIIWALRRVAAQNQNKVYAGYFRTTRLAVLMFNFIVAHCFVTAIIDSACFRELFNQQDSFSSSGYSLSCAASYFFYVNGTFVKSCSGSSSSTGLQSGLTAEELAVPFVPPFIYNYQCGSALITNYVPVLLYNFFLTGFITPVVTLLFFYQPQAAQRCLPSWSRNLLFQPVHLLRDDDYGSGSYSGRGAVDIKTDSNQPRNSSMKKSESSIVSNVSGIRPRTIYKVTTTMDQLTVSTVVLMTFGLSAPFLAIVILCSMLSETVMLRLVLGRYLYACQSGPPGPRCRDVTISSLYSNSNSSGTSSSSCDDSSAFDIACCRVEEALEGSWREPFHSAFIVVLVTVLFWGLLIFDMLGEATNSSTAAELTVAWMMCAPLLIHWVVRMYLSLGLRERVAKSTLRALRRGSQRILIRMGKVEGTAPPASFS